LPAWRKTLAGGSADQYLDLVLSSFKVFAVVAGPAFFSAPASAAVPLHQAEQAFCPHLSTLWRHRTTVTTCPTLNSF
jgi:hypothetical protein